MFPFWINFPSNWPSSDWELEMSSKNISSYTTILNSVIVACHYILSLFPEHYIKFCVFILQGFSAIVTVFVATVTASPGKFSVPIKL